MRTLALSLTNGSAQFRIVSALVALTLVLPLGMLAVPHASAFEYMQCSNGMDDDRDGKTDYPRDPECDSLDDNTEAPNEGVFVTVSDGRESVSAGDALTYIITLKQQRYPVKLVDVSLHVPAQHSVVSVSDDGSYSSTGIRWQKVAVFNGSTRRLTVHVVASPYVQNDQLLIARVLADSSEATDTTMVNGRPIPYPNNQLIVSVSDHRDSAGPGDVLDYIVSVRNPEPNGTVTDVRVKFPIVLRDVNAGGTRIVGDEIIWKDVRLDAYQERSFSFRASVDTRVPQHYPIQVVARAGNVVAHDRTITGGHPYSLFTTITDNRDSARRGDLLTYVIHIDNGSGRLNPDANITASLPIHGEFVSATEGGMWDGNNVRWMHVQVAPGGSRDLEFTVRVRSDAPNDTLLRASTTVQGFTATDVTQVNDSGIINPNAYSGPLSIQKTTDRPYAAAGSMVSYTVTVRNANGRAMRNVSVSDVYDSRSFTVTDAGSGRADSGRIVWNLESLQPGETRTLRYTGRLSRSLSSGDSVLNTARAYSTDVAYTPAAVSSVEVYDQLMPQTGIADFFSPLENTAQYLTPISAAAEGNGLPLVLWIIVSTIGLAAGAVTAKKFSL